MRNKLFKKISLYPYIYISFFCVTFLLGFFSSEALALQPCTGPPPLDTTPVPHIKANGVSMIGSSGSINPPVVISRSDNLSISISLDACGRTIAADWWVTAFKSNNSDSFSYNLSTHTFQLSPHLIVTYQGPLFDLSPYEVLNISGLPLGQYFFSFLLEAPADGVPDPGLAVLVEVDVIP